MKKVVTVLGARPQFVKAAVLSRIIKKHQEFEEIIVHTGQHFDSNMSDIFFTEMDIPRPKYHLKINNLSHGAMTGKMLEEIEAILIDENPEALIVYGDTNSTLAGALAAKKLNIKVIHIEAGLRSFNMQMPEEVNRILTDRISDLLSCPTDKAIENLNNEGFGNLAIQVEKHGDIMKDAVEFYQQSSAEKSSIIENLNLKNKKFVLTTLHRQENTDDLLKLKSIIKALEHINKETEIVIPLHPRTKKVLDKNHIKTSLNFINPVGYFDMLELLKNCNMVLTDSGGLQKEAFFNQKNCVILREETEWVELVEHDFAKIAGYAFDSIVDTYKYFSNKSSNFDISLYGDNVGEKIYASIAKLILN